MLGRVVSLRRYPVKSMRGESLPSALVDSRGVIGDRLFALRDRDGKFGSGKTTRRFRRIDGLFGFRAALEGGTTPVIECPDGRVLRGEGSAIDAALTEALGTEVTLAREDRISHFDTGALHIITSASLDWLKSRLPNSAIDARRFRPNVVVETADTGLVEQAWLNRVLAIGGELRVKVTVATERCVMITNPQEELEADVSIMRMLAQGNDECFGVYAEIITPGRIRCGDTIAFTEAE